MANVDLQLKPDGETLDLVIQGGDLVMDEGLLTPMLVSLFTDAVAAETDELPSAGSTRRGWWGDAYLDQAVAGVLSSLGSRLWLRERSVITGELLAEIEEDVATALRWMVETDLCGGVTVEVTRNGENPRRLDIAVTMTDPDESYSCTYDL